MNCKFKAALLGGALAVGSMGSGLPGAAAQAIVTPAPDPIVGSAPAAPSGSSEAYDEVAIGQLMKIVELGRLIGGGISQLFAEAANQKQALDLIRNAQIGPKTFPLLNSPAEISQREGGTGLKEMADEVRNGTLTAPTDLLAPLKTFRDSYKLDTILGLKDDPSVSKALLARASAQAVIAASTAELSYKRANASMARLNDYIAALQASADLKTSVDINTRVMIEVSQQLNETLRTQAALASIAGSYMMAIGGETRADTFLDELLKR